MSRDISKTRAIQDMRGWAVLVGINHYTDPTIRPLRYCVNDAQELYELLVVSPATGYQRERMRLLTSAAKEHITANRRDIFTNLAEVAAQVTNQELLLFYYAGHGQVMDNEVYLLPTDVENHLAMSDLAVSLRRIKEIIQKSKARTKIVILDACYCGVPLERGLTQRGLAQQKREFIHRLTQEAQGFAILAPSARDEPALEWEEKRHGVFSYFLLEGLREAVDTQPVFDSLSRCRAKQS